MSKWKLPLRTCLVLGRSSLREARRTRFSYSLHRFNFVRLTLPHSPFYILLTLWAGNHNPHFHLNCLQEHDLEVAAQFMYNLFKASIYQARFATMARSCVSLSKIKNMLWMIAKGDLAAQRTLTLVLSSSLISPREVRYQPT